MIAPRPPAAATWSAAIASAATPTIAGHEDAGAVESRRARLAVTTERLRIAEELNSAITRSIRSISLQAGTGSQIVETDPAAALEMLEAISVTSREALADLRRLLKRMRTADEPSQYTPRLLPPARSEPDIRSDHPLSVPTAAPSPAPSRPAPSGSPSPTTRHSSAAASSRCCGRRRASRWWARPPTGSKRCRWPRPPGPT